MTSVKNLFTNAIIFMTVLLSQSSFLQTHNIDKNSKMLVTPMSIEPLDLWFQVQHSPSWTNLAFAFKTETLDSLRSHILLILTKSSKSKN